MNLSNYLHDNNDIKENQLNSLIDCFFQEDNSLINDNSITDTLLLNQFPSLKLHNSQDFGLNEELSNFSLQDIASKHLSCLNSSSELKIDLDRIKSSLVITENLNQNNNLKPDIESIISKKNHIILPLTKCSNDIKNDLNSNRKHSKFSSLLFKNFKLYKSTLEQSFDVKEQKNLILFMKKQRKCLV
jgi:hypothetical protein